MRKVKYFIANTLDGFIAREDGSVDWLLMDGTDYGMSEFFKSIDAVLLGRKTYEFALTQGHGMKSSKGMSCYVFSRTLKPAHHSGVEIISENAGEFVRNLKREAGKDIWLMGGGNLAASLLAEGVVDEISLNIHPVLLGSGIQLFPEIGKQLDLKMTDWKAHKNGCLQLTYQVKT
ncbi:MAG TPA: dihydrofolate reductase family protein [Pyrinomonadaceae bacterium]|jgi:dihydrofolate reductase|nr:dihydrofolate reductase family protein [Pyrinomonadaceae bacterium]